MSKSQPKVQENPSTASSNPSQGSSLALNCGIDLVGPLPTTDAGYAYIATATYLFSKQPEAEPLPNKTAAAVANFLLKLICRHGCCCRTQPLILFFPSHLYALSSADLGMPMLKIVSNKNYRRNVYVGCVCCTPSFTSCHYTRLLLAILDLPLSSLCLPECLPLPSLPSSLLL